MAAEALEQSVLEAKDKDQLLAIAQALGIRTSARAAKATLISKILETTGASAPTREPELPLAPATVPAAEPVLGPDGEPLADWEVDLIRAGDEAAAPAAAAAPTAVPAPAPRPAPAPQPAPAGDHDGDADGDDGDDEGDDGDGPDGEGTDGDGAGGVDGESRNSRRRRRRRNKNRTGDGQPEGAPVRPDQPRPDQPRTDQARADRPDVVVRGDRPERQERHERDLETTTGPFGNEPVAVAGLLDLRDEGYGFLRVNGYLPSRDDAYIPVKLTRQYGLRKGDHVTGLSRPAGRNEKNPAMLEIHSVNGAEPDLARTRHRFDELTPVHPHERLRLEAAHPTGQPGEVTARVIDLIAPIGKGQRALLVAPPKAGKTTVMKAIAAAVERNHPDVTVMVLLVDERPEEVTEMRRTVAGEVIASTFDRPADEHVHVAELAIEKAKRLAELGNDVVLIVDGITRLSRAHHVAAPSTGRTLAGGIDAGALQAAKKFFGAARALEEGGSLTIVATLLVDTNSRIDDAIVEEVIGTANLELRLDRRLAERRVYPAIDVEASGTRREELLFDAAELPLVWSLRRSLAADEGAAIEPLVARVTSTATNADLLRAVAGTA